MSTLINRFAPFDDALAGAYERNLLAALMEDIGTGDLTGKLVPEDGRATARVIVREEAVLCGAPWFEGVMQALDAAIGIEWHYAEGDLMAAAGVEYSVGREAQTTYGEQWNGVQTGILHHRHQPDNVEAHIADRCEPILRAGNIPRERCGFGKQEVDSRFLHP